MTDDPRNEIHGYHRHNQRVAAANGIGTVPSAGQVWRSKERMLMVVSLQGTDLRYVRMGRTREEVAQASIQAKHPWTFGAWVIEPWYISVEISNATIDTTEDMELQGWLHPSDAAYLSVASSVASDAIAVTPIPSAIGELLFALHEEYREQDHPHQRVINIEQASDRITQTPDDLDMVTSIYRSAQNRGWSCRIITYEDPT